MSQFERQHGDLAVHITRDRSNRITKVDLLQGDESDTVERMGPELIQLTAEQAYALADDVAVADADTWAKRDPIQHYQELALRRVADYFQGRAELNRKHKLFPAADIFDIARTRVLEEIEALYADDESRDPQRAVSDNLARRS